MSVIASERASERARQSGIETGGGAVDRANEREKSGAGGSFDEVLLRADGAATALPIGLDGRVDIAAVISAERPIDQQREAIDNKQKRIGERPAETESATSDAARPNARITARSDASASGVAARSGMPASTDNAADTLPGATEATGVGPKRDASRAAPVVEDVRAQSEPVVSRRDVGSPLVGNLALGNGGADRGQTQASVGGAAGLRSVAASGSVQGGGSSGGAGGGLLGDRGPQMLSRLVGVGRGTGSGGRGDSPFRMEQESPVSAQVSRGLAQVLKGKGGEVTLRLRPEHLGEIRANVRIEHGAVAVRVLAATDEARALLEREATSLRAALESRGFEVEHIKVEGPARSADPSHETKGPEEQREDRAAGQEDGKSPADGDRPRGENLAHGRAGWLERVASDALGEPSPEATVGPDARCAYGVSGVAVTEWDGVLRLDAVA